VLTEVMQLQIT